MEALKRQVAKLTENFSIETCRVHFNEWLVPADDLLSKDYEQHVRAIISQVLNGMGVNDVTITLYVKYKLCRAYRRLVPTAVGA